VAKTAGKLTFDFNNDGVTDDADAAT